MLLIVKMPNVFVMEKHHCTRLNSQRVVMRDYINNVLLFALGNFDDGAHCDFFSSVRGLGIGRFLLNSEAKLVNLIWVSRPLEVRFHDSICEKFALEFSIISSP